jgi:hypothetical protein
VIKKYKKLYFLLNQVIQICAEYYFVKQKIETKRKVADPCPHRAYCGRERQRQTKYLHTTTEEENKWDDVTWELLSITWL